MNIYEKPMLIIESLVADSTIASDAGNLAELDPLNGDEVSITAPEDWFDY
jgi:hypothetical protein